MKTVAIICPGIHSPQLTESFIQGVRNIIEPKDCLILSTEQYKPYCAISIEQWLKTHYSSPKNAPVLSFLSFSAGVVGSIIAANQWQLQGGRINSFVAFDGWGMPLLGNFPIYRVSHDRFTHDTSAIFGRGENEFYADPAVSHLELWRLPNACDGWLVISNGMKVRCSLLEYLESKVKCNV